MCKFIRQLSFVILSLVLSSFTRAFAQNTAQLNIDTRHSAPIAAGFSGFNSVGSDTPASYDDPYFQNLVRELKPGVLRWPGGTVDDFFNWKKGLTELKSTSTPPVWTMIDVMMAHFGQNSSASFYKQVAGAEGPASILIGKGGNPLGTSTSGFAGLAKSAGDSKLLIVVNTISGTPEAAHDLAFYAASNGLPVSAFELGNEPFYVKASSSVAGPYPNASARGRLPKVPGSFSSGTDYATKMKPYYESIKKGYVDAGLPRSAVVVAIAGGYSTDTDSWMADWDQSLTSYVNSSGAYWDAVVMHQYPTKAKPGSGFDDEMASANEALASGTDKYYINELSAKPWAVGKSLLVSEYDVTFDDKTMNGSVYGAIFVAEYVARMSRVPNLLTVAMHELTSDNSGIGAPSTALAGSSNWTKTLKAAGVAGQPIRTIGQVSGLYYGAQVLGAQLVNRAVNNSDARLPSELTGVGGTVATVKSGTLPAVFAQAYHGRLGAIHVLITNKGSVDKTITVLENGQALEGTFHRAWIATSGGDPSEHNSSGGSGSTVKVQTATVSNPVTIPMYSVTHLIIERVSGD